jgi:hypothetical protein
MRKYVLLFSVSCLFLSSCSSSGNSNLSKPDNPSDPTPTVNALPPASVPAPAPSPQRVVVPTQSGPKRVSPRAPAFVPPTPPAVVNPEPPPHVPEPAPATPTPVEAAAVPPPLSPPPPVHVVDTHNVTIPAGTEISVRMIDSVDAKTAHENETFRASIDSPVVIDKQTVLPKGGDVYLKVVHVSSAGEIKGQSNLQVALDRIVLGKNSYPVDTNVYETSGAAQGQKTVRNGAVGAAIGAAIGAIAGGRKGAVIGAGAGGGAGVGTAVLTKDDVRIESETRLVFTLTNPIDIAALPPGASDRDSLTGPARLEAPSDSLPRNRFPQRRRN